MNIQQIIRGFTSIYGKLDDGDREELSSTVDVSFMLDHMKATGEIDSDDLDALIFLLDGPISDMAATGIEVCNLLDKLILLKNGMTDADMN